MDRDTAPLGPWYHKWVRGGQAITGLWLTLSSSLIAATQFRSGQIGMGWLFIGFAFLMFGYGIFNLVRWMEMRRASAR